MIFKFKDVVHNVQTSDSILFCKWLIKLFYISRIYKVVKSSKYIYILVSCTYQNRYLLPKWFCPNYLVIISEIALLALIILNLYNLSFYFFWFVQRYIVQAYLDLRNSYLPFFNKEWRKIYVANLKKVSRKIMHYVGKVHVF